MEKIRKIVFIILGISFVFFFISAYVHLKKGKNRFLNEEYIGILINIKEVKNNRGAHHIQIKNNWISLGHSIKVQNYIQIGDSIVKKSGTKTIKVYRKKINGKWHEKIFK